MSKYILLAIVSLIPLNAYAAPKHYKCNPSIGNWINAAKTTCPIAFQDTTSSKSAFNPEPVKTVKPVKK